MRSTASRPSSVEGGAAPISSLIVIDAPSKCLGEADVEGQPRWMSEMKGRLVSRGPRRRTAGEPMRILDSL